MNLGLLNSVGLRANGSGQPNIELSNRVTGGDINWLRSYWMITWNYNEPQQTEKSQITRRGVKFQIYHEPVNRNHGRQKKSHAPKDHVLRGKHQKVIIIIHIKILVESFVIQALMSGSQGGRSSRGSQKLFKMATKALLSTPHSSSV